MIQISSMGRFAKKLIRKTAKWAAIMAIPAVFVSYHISEYQRIKRSSEYYHADSGGNFSFHFGDVKYERTIGRIQVPTGNNPARLPTYKDGAFYEIITAHLPGGISIECREDDLDSELDSFRLYKQIPHPFATNQKVFAEYCSRGRSIEDSLKGLTPEMAWAVTSNYATARGFMDHKLAETK